MEAEQDAVDKIKTMQHLSAISQHCHVGFQGKGHDPFAERLGGVWKKLRHCLQVTNLQTRQRFVKLACTVGALNIVLI